MTENPCFILATRIERLCSPASNFRRAAKNNDGLDRAISWSGATPSTAKSSRRTKSCGHWGPRDFRADVGNDRRRTRDKRRPESDGIQLVAMTARVCLPVKTVEAAFRYSYPPPASCAALTAASRSLLASVFLCLTGMHRTSQLHVHQVICSKCPEFPSIFVLTLPHLPCRSAGAGRDIRILLMFVNSASHVHTLR
jgi:hypothetical protein